MKSEGVKDVAKWLKKEIRKAKKALESAKKDRADFGMYEDCGDSYEGNVIEAQSALDTLIHIKIKTERYAKKLRHQEQGQ